MNAFGLVFKHEQTSVALCWRGFPVSWSKTFPINFLLRNAQCEAPPGLPLCESRGLKQHRLWSGKVKRRGGKPQALQCLPQCLPPLLWTHLGGEGKDEKCCQLFAFSSHCYCFSFPVEWQILVFQVVHLIAVLCLRVGFFFCWACQIWVCTPWPTQTWTVVFYNTSLVILVPAD